jgi:ferric-dicitrate binding protein FerR (iron transport regulator)
MRNSTTKSLISIAMAVLFPCSMMMAETNGAILRASGPAMLNGAVVNRQAAVLKGDLVTATTVPVSLSSNGNTVDMPGNSSVRFDGSSISLQSGHAVVTTASGMSAKIDTITVAPSSKSARYEVVRNDGKVTIAAITGAVDISDATHSTVLPEGYMTTIDPQEDSKVPSPGARKDKAAGWGMSRRTAILIGVGAAAAAGIIAYELSNSPDKLSGQLP